MPTSNPLLGFTSRKWPTSRALQQSSFVVHSVSMRQRQTYHEEAKPHSFETGRVFQSFDVIQSSCLAVARSGGLSRKVGWGFRPVCILAIVEPSDPESINDKESPCVGSGALTDTERIWRSCKISGKRVGLMVSGK